jgi:hypothetical protein
MPASSLLTCPLRSPDLAQQTTELGHVLGAVRRARDFGGAISDQQRCVADTAGGRRYSSSVMAPAQRYEAGIPRTIRRIQKYCARGDLNCRIKSGSVSRSYRSPIPMA